MTRVLIIKDPEEFGVFDIDALPEEIVRTVNQGRTEVYFPDLHGRLFARQQAEVVVITGEKPELPSSLPKLSQREYEVLALLGEGLTTAQIALELKLSQRTIRGYVAKMKKHLKAQNIQQLLAKAVALGLVHPEM